MELYKPFKSKAKNKKYSVYVIKDGKRKLIHFGDTRMEHYEDKLGLYSNLNHYDDDRRKSYLARSGSIKNNKGQLTKNDRSSPNYYSRTYLW